MRWLLFFAIAIYFGAHSTCNALLIGQASISGDSIEKHITYLANDSLNGRAVGTAGETKAAKYIAVKLKNYNLAPGAENGSFFQRVPMHGSIPLPNSELKLLTNGQAAILDLQHDYLLYKAGAQTYLPKPVSLVFVGYGIIAPEFDYNDYQSVNVAGKIVVFMSGEPYSEDRNYFDGIYPTVYDYPESKHRLAISNGAVGSILIPNLFDNRYKDWEKWKKEFAFEDVK
jgi:hypothetical protein